jgi:CHRD domain
MESMMTYIASLNTRLLGVLIALASASASAQTMQVTLAGSQEVPPVSTAASASGTISVAADLAISGSVSTTGVEGTMAHIHKAAAGQNGPVIVPMVKTAENVWSIPAGAKLTEAQYQDLKDGNLYINVHSAAHKGGEIRGQLKP